MVFVSRNETRIVNHLLTLTLKASHLVRLVKRLIVWSRDLRFFFHLRDPGLSFFCE